MGKALETGKRQLKGFKNYEKSTVRTQVVLFSHAQQRAPIERQLSKIKAAEQNVALESLVVIISTLKYLNIQ